MLWWYKIKYADVMALVECVNDIQSLDSSFQFTISFGNFIIIWMEESSCNILVKLKKCGANNVRALCKPLLFNWEKVEQVWSFKILGTEINSQLINRHQLHPTVWREGVFKTPISEGPNYKCQFYSKMLGDICKSTRRNLLNKEESVILNNCCR